MNSANVAKVWRIALLDPDVAVSAWPVLARWLRRVNVDDRLLASVRDLLLRAVQGERERRRTLFYLERVWIFNDEVPQWVRELLTER